MKLQTSRRTRGIMLMDCLSYMAVLFLVLGLALALFYRCWGNSLGLHRNADDIVRTLQAGERWRTDVRSATAPLRVEGSAEDQVLRIPQGDGEVIYFFWQGSVWRRINDDAAWVEVLPQVKSSQMQLDSRQRVTACRWEVELRHRREPARVRPLFTFLAVPIKETRP